MHVLAQISGARRSRCFAALGGIRERASAGEKDLLCDETGAVLRLSQNLLGELAKVEPRDNCDDRKDEQRDRQRELGFKAEPHLSALPRIPLAYCGGSSSLCRASPLRAFYFDWSRPASGESTRVPPHQPLCRLGIATRQDRKPSLRVCGRNRTEDAGA